MDLCGTRASGTRLVCPIAEGHLSPYRQGHTSARGRWVVASCVVRSLLRWVIASFGRWVALGLRAAPRRKQAPGVRPQQVSRRGVGRGAGTAADGPVRAQAAFAPQAPLILEDREHRRPAVDVQ